MHLQLGELFLFTLYFWFVYFMWCCECAHSVVSDSLQPQTPLSMEISRQEYWSGLPFPTLEDLPNPGIKPASLVSPALAGRFFTDVPPGKPVYLGMV